MTLIVALGALDAGAASSAPANDAVVLEMHQAFQRGNAKRLSELLPAARAHTLEPWAAYWELSARLNRAEPAELDAFFNRYQGSYQEDRLRNDWLLLLGERRDWGRFAQNLALFRMQDDREVRCYALAMAQTLNAVNQADEVKNQWYAQKEPGAGCALAARQHYAAGALTAPDIWRKARLALTAHQFKAARLALDIVAPQQGAHWREIIDQPERFLSRLTSADKGETQELALLALLRWAEHDPARAAQALLKRWRAHLSKAQRSWAWGTIGAQAAQQHSPDALAYFAHAELASMSDEQLAWRARAALWQHQWHAALSAIEAMSSTQAQQSSWVYWRARALLQPGRSAPEQSQARKLLQSLAGVRGFYQLLAQDALGIATLVPARPSALTPAEIQAAQTNPGLQRALAAFALGLRSEGVREWNYSTNMHQTGGMGERELLAAAELACSQALWDRCINTSARTLLAFDVNQRFPMPYQEQLVARSRQIGIDPAYVYGLIRQESRFIMDAHSGVGASGLMQVMPKTAKWTAKKVGLSGFSLPQLSQPDTNISIGTAYLKLILDAFDGSQALAAAAYNAGPSRPASWRAASGSAPLEAAIWIENIPFFETRDYVKKVLANSTLYGALLSAEPARLSARLGLIAAQHAGHSMAQDLP